MDSSSCPKEKHDVFLSFRGEDTRDNFTSHLYAALRRKNIQVYMDETSLERGDEISPTLTRAIRESKISLVIFSKNYAQSSWCLGELVEILERRKRTGQLVVPVFYQVDPSNIRKQRGSFEQALKKHEKRFKDRVQNWRDALTESANLAGWNSRVTRPESKLVEDIAKDILEKLNHIPLSDEFKGLIGIEKRMKRVESLIDTGSPDVLMVGIWGMGGIGKTTLAEVVFNRLRSEFESCCFLENVSKELNVTGGLRHLRSKLIADLVKEVNVNIGTPSLLPPFLMKRLRSLKVLIVLDDVDQSQQLEYLVGDYGIFEAGSRIIITTRDERVLREFRVTLKYQVEALDFDESIRLFVSRASEGNAPSNDYMKLSKEVVYCVGGIPLALRVLGSYLLSCRSRGKETWEMAIDKLIKKPLDNVLNVLKISYDRLDETEKAIFLDIACFFKGMDRHHVEQILHEYDIPVTFVIDNLMDKSLVTIRNDNQLWMHDLVQKLGWNIAHKESQRLEKRRRLPNSEDVCHIFKKNMEMKVIEGIRLDVSVIDEEVYISSTVFERMHNLRVFMIENSGHSKKSKVHLREDLKFLPDSLIYLHWNEYPRRSLPPKFAGRSLVQLVMRHSKLEHLWDGVQDLGNLKHFDLSYSKNLIEIPDLSKARKLQRIHLKECTSLVHVPSSIGNLESLMTLVLRGCSSIDKFPKVPRSIIYLDLGWTAIGEVPASSVQCLSILQEFYLDGCSRLQSIPTSIYNLKSLQRLLLFDYLVSNNFPLTPIYNLEFLKYLSLRDCKSLRKFPELPRNIEYLDLGETDIEQVPSSTIENLFALKMLFLDKCKRLERLPPSVGKLKSLRVLCISGCSQLKSLPKDMETMGHCQRLKLKFTPFDWSRISEIYESLGDLCLLRLSFMVGLINDQYKTHWEPNIIRDEPEPSANIHSLI